MNGRWTAEEESVMKASLDSDTSSYWDWLLLTNWSKLTFHWRSTGSLLLLLDAPGRKEKNAFHVFVCFVFLFVFSVRSYVFLLMLYRRAFIKIVVDAAKIPDYIWVSGNPWCHPVAWNISNHTLWSSPQLRTCSVCWNTWQQNMAPENRTSRQYRGPDAVFIHLNVYLFIYLKCL